MKVTVIVFCAVVIGVNSLAVDLSSMSDDELMELIKEGMANNDMLFDLDNIKNFNFS